MLQYRKHLKTILNLKKKEEFLNYLNFSSRPFYRIIIQNMKKDDDGYEFVKILIDCMNLIEHESIYNDAIIEICDSYPSKEKQTHESLKKIECRQAVLACLKLNYFCSFYKKKIHEIGRRNPDFLVIQDHLRETLEHPRSGMLVEYKPFPFSMMVETYTQCIKIASDCIGSTHVLMILERIFSNMLDRNKCEKKYFYHQLSRFQFKYSFKDLFLVFSNTEYISNLLKAEKPVIMELYLEILGDLKPLYLEIEKKYKRYEDDAKFRLKMRSCVYCAKLYSEYPDLDWSKCVKCKKSYYCSRVCKLVDSQHIIVCKYYHKGLSNQKGLDKLAKRDFKKIRKKEGYVCQYCKKRKMKMQKCAGCGEAYYCDKECQKNDWKIHRIGCIRFKK